MRIGGGAVNRRQLRSIPGSAVRPTGARVRQALFNILRASIEDAIFLDLYAGTGSVGLEALSHGARHVYFIEYDRRVLPVLRANIQRCAAAGRSTVVAAALPHSGSRPRRAR